MKKNIILLAVSCIAVLFGFNCSKTNNSCYSDEPPDATVWFQLYENGELVMDSSFLRSVKLYYVQDNQKKYANMHGYFDFPADTVDYKYFENRLMRIDILQTCTIKEYYLEYPVSEEDWTTDTLYVNFLPPSPNTNCQYMLNEFKYNGVTLKGDRTVINYCVYILFKLNKTVQNRLSVLKMNNI
jgi:hypothetical protein